MLPIQPQSDGVRDLLEPSLQQAIVERPLYSVRAGFLTSFFGGVYAAAIFGLVNAARMRRLGKDAWLCAGAVLLWSAFLVWSAQFIGATSAPEWLGWLGDPGRTVRRISNAAGLLLFGLQYLRQRSLYKAYSLSGRDHPNPWPLGLSSVAAAAALTFVLIALGRVS
jgi:hypothetical protein